MLHPQCPETYLEGTDLGNLSWTSWQGFRNSRLAQ